MDHSFDIFQINWLKIQNLRALTFKSFAFNLTNLLLNF